MLKSRRRGGEVRVRVEPVRRRFADWQLAQVTISCIRRDRVLDLLA